MSSNLIPLNQASGKTVARVEEVSPHYEVEYYDNGARYTMRVSFDNSGSHLDPLWDRVMRFNLAASHHVSLKVPPAHTR